jgi:internalin A
MTHKELLQKIRQAARDSATELDLSGNGLTMLPQEIGQLTKLTELYLVTNELTVLPPEIGQLSNLTILDLKSNRLTALPPEIGQLTKLEWLDLRNNSLPIPPEILAKTSDPAAILNYYFQAGRSKPLNEAKLLLVGQGSVGKTSLIKGLVEGRFDPHEAITEGINITKWPMIVEGYEISFNIWDFGGQEIMHATHQFFLTKRSLYLLVLDARLGEEENRLEYWLKIIGSFGGDSPVIVVGNKIDQHPLDLDQRGLQMKYPNLKAIVETSCRDGRGLDELRQVIAAEVGALAHLHDPLPLAWFAVKSRLEELETDFVSYEEYAAMCQVAGIADDLSRRTLIGFLHDLGVVLNFQDDPRLEDTNILNPEWVTNGVYKILNNNALMTEHRGVLDWDSLTRILDPHAYPTNKRSLILDMMRKFELCFDFEGFTDRKFLVPDLLPREEPYTGEWDDALVLQYHYSVLPGSIISRFIVRMNSYIHQKTYWRSGVVLAYEGNTALVKADREDRKIFIRVGGPERGRRICLAVIRSQLAAIHQTIPGLEVEEKVPLPGYPDVVVGYEHLLNLERLGEMSFIPERTSKRFSVRQLLDGIEEEQARRERQADYPRPERSALQLAPRHPTDAIRKLLNDTFSDEELEDFCYDKFRPVFEQFTSQMNRRRKIQLLIEHCERYEQFDELFTLLRAINPTQYANFMTQAGPFPD